MYLFYKRLVPLVYLHVGLHIVSDALTAENVLGTKVLGNAVQERITNFSWPAVQQVRDLSVYFLSSSFLLLPIFSLSSNNAARHDLPNSRSVRSGRVGRYRIVGRSVRTCGKHGVYHHISQ